MSAELDSELRADFLNESRDLMERLGEQLVELERQPKDKELLNAVFRGFHTIKGGAGFFALDPVVHLCTRRRMSSTRCAASASRSMPN